jgi:hypothetical protein
MTKEFYKFQLGFLEKYFGFNLSQTYVGMYWEMLKHLDDDKFKLASENIIKEFIPTATVPFPLIVHFLKHCGESGDNQAIAAIARLKKSIQPVGKYQSINFHDPALHYSINAFGGWTTLCCWGDDDWNVNEKRILETYKMAVAMKYGDEEHLIGIAEKDQGYFNIYSVNQIGKIALQCRNNPLQITEKEESKKIGVESWADMVTKRIE